MEFLQIFGLAGWWRWTLVSPERVAPSRMVGVSASVNLPLHHKVQKFSSGTGSPGWSHKEGSKTLVCVLAYTTYHKTILTFYYYSEQENQSRLLNKTQQTSHCSCLYVWHQLWQMDCTQTARQARCSHIPRPARRRRTKCSSQRWFTNDHTIDASQRHRHSGRHSFTPMTSRTSVTTYNSDVTSCVQKYLSGWAQRVAVPASESGTMSGRIYSGNVTATINRRLWFSAHRCCY